MNDMDIIRLIAGLLQFGVALYALRLSRLFKSMLMGWVLFGALSVLALLNLFLAVEPFDAGAQWGIKVDVIYSLLLLAGVMRFYSGLKNARRSAGLRRKLPNGNWRRKRGRKIYRRCWPRRAKTRRPCRRL